MNKNRFKKKTEWAYSGKISPSASSEREKGSCPEDVLKLKKKKKEE